MQLISTGAAETVAFEYRERIASGRWLWILRRGNAVHRDSSGAITRYIGTDTDISAIKLAEQARAINDKHLEIAVSMAELGIWKYDFDTGQVTWDARLRALYGAPEVGPLPPGIWEKSIHPDDLDRVQSLTDAGMAKRQDYSMDYRIIRADGAVRHIRSRVSFVCDPQSGPITLGVDWDMTEDMMKAFRLDQMNRIAAERLAELTEAQGELRRLSNHDPLTGLANRRSLQEYLDRLQSEGATGFCLAFVMMDIDDFKAVNDTLGHAFGDRLLQSVAAVLNGELSPHGLVARTGGDEFLAILEHMDSAQMAISIATAATSKASEVSRALGHEITISVGIDTGSVQAKTIAELLSRADRAMYRAKNSGGARAVLA